MKIVLTLIVMFFTATPVLAGNFFSYHDSLFRDYALCEDGLTNQEQAEIKFKEMYETLKAADSDNTKSNVEVVSYTAYNTELRNRVSGNICEIGFYGNCYTASCE